MFGLRSHVNVWTTNILYHILLDQIHFSDSWHAEMSLTINEPMI